MCRRESVGWWLYPIRVGAAADVDRMHRIDGMGDGMDSRVRGNDGEGGAGMTERG